MHIHILIASLTPPQCVYQTRKKGRSYVSRVSIASFYDFLLDLGTVTTVVFLVFHFIVTMNQLYHDSSHWCRNKPRRTIDVPQVTDKISHIIVVWSTPLSALEFNSLSFVEMYSPYDRGHYDPFTIK